MKHTTSGHISLAKPVTPPCLPPRGQESTIQLCPRRTRYNLWTAWLTTLSLSPGSILSPVDQVIFKNVSQMVSLFFFPFPPESKPDFPWLLQGHYVIWCPLPIWSHVPYFQSLCSLHSSAVVSFLLLTQARNTSIFGFLHWLFPLPRLSLDTCMTITLKFLSHLLQVFAQMSSYLTLHLYTLVFD